MMLRRKMFFLIIPVMLAIITIYLFNQMLDIRFQSDFPLAKVKSSVAADKSETQFIGVVSRFSPSLLYKGYQPLIDYLNEQTEYHFELRLNKTYEESVRQLATGELQASFLGTYIFMTKMDDYPIYAFMAPLNSSGEPRFQTVLITREDKPYKEIADLSGKKIGVPSRLSFSGNWLQNYVLPGIFTEEKFQPDFIHYDFHHTVVQHVIRGDLDGGVVKDRVANEYLGKGLQIVERSIYIPSSPLVAGPGSTEEIISAIKIALVKIDSSQFSLLESWDQEFRNGFTMVGDSLYIKFKQHLELIN